MNAGDFKILKIWRDKDEFRNQTYIAIQIQIRIQSSDIETVIACHKNARFDFYANSYLGPMAPDRRQIQKTILNFVERHRSILEDCPMASVGRIFPAKSNPKTIAILFKLL